MNDKKIIQCNCCNKVITSQKDLVVTSTSLKFTPYCMACYTEKNRTADSKLLPQPVNDFGSYKMPIISVIIGFALLFVPIVRYGAFLFFIGPIVNFLSWYKVERHVMPTVIGFMEPTNLAGVSRRGDQSISYAYKRKKELEEIGQLQVLMASSEPIHLHFSDHVRIRVDAFLQPRKSLLRILLLPFEVIGFTIVSYWYLWVLCLIGSQFVQYNFL